MEITAGVCSMFTESLTLPQTKIRNLPSLMSAFKRRVIERNIPYSRALIHNGKLTLFTLQKGVKRPVIPFTIKAVQSYSIQLILGVITFPEQSEQ